VHRSDPGATPSRAGRSVPDPTTPEPPDPAPDAGPDGETAERSGGRPRHARRSAWTTGRWLLLGLSVVALVAAGAITYNVAAFYHRSDTGGKTLIHEAQRNVTRARTQHLCTASAAAAAAATSTSEAASAVGTSGLNLAGGTTGVGAGGLPAPSALLKAPTIGLVAPVVDGTDDAQLAVAVGRVPASSTLGSPGTVVLAAHDVTWFSQIDGLHAGDTITLVQPCTTYTYRVTDHQVVSAGAPIYQTADSRLVLVTCYPLNALFITSQRYLVDATLVATTSVSGRVAATTTAGTPTIAIPPDLSAQGLLLDQNPTQLGTLTVAGQADPAWQQSSAPLDDQAALLSLYFAGIDAARADRSDWWAAVAPNVPMSTAAAFDDARISHYASPLNTTLNVSGSVLSSASLSGEVELEGGDNPGPYNITMQASVVNGALQITGWTMTPADG
jgi:sortase A